MKYVAWYRKVSFGCLVVLCMLVFGLFVRWARNWVFINVLCFIAFFLYVGETRWGEVRCFLCSIRCVCVQCSVFFENVQIDSVLQGFFRWCSCDMGSTYYVQGTVCSVCGWERVCVYYVHVDHAYGCVVIRRIELCLFLRVLLRWYDEFTNTIRLCAEHMVCGSLQR